MGDFWKDFSFPSAIDDILQKDSFALEDLLDEDEVVTETRSHKDKLIDFLATTETITKLLAYITEEAPEGASEQRTNRYPGVACEILCSEVAEIDSFICENTEFLDKLYNFFEQEQLEGFLTICVCRVAGSLLVSKIPETLAYMRSKENFLDRFLQHIGNPSITDFITKIINIEGEGVMDWLLEAKLITKIIDKFEPSQDSQSHEDGCQALLDIMVVSSYDSKLMQQLESDAILTQLLDYTLAPEGQNSSLLHGTEVIISMIRRIIEAEEDEEDRQPDFEAPPRWLDTLFKYLEQYKALLINVPEDWKRTVSLSFNITTEAFGFHRLKILELFNSLLALGFDSVDEKIFELGLFNIALDLFFAFEWNNFVHHLVERIFRHVLESATDLKVRVLTDTNIIKRLCEAAEKSATAEDHNNGQGVRLAFMGHVLNLGGTIKELISMDENIKKVVDANAEAWKVLDDKFLSKREELAAKPLCGITPERPDDEGDMEDSQYMEDFNNDSKSDDSDEDGDNVDEDVDMSSDTDGDDYDVDQAEVLLSKQEIESGSSSD
mmetsp:Transcript_29240/g.32476  ORF Transcript_29240/g.32476 Transcript_29240/m.32476 type:complete len:551 (-) Transcript_29240:322-1974(-)